MEHENFHGISCQPPSRAEANIASIVAQRAKCVFDRPRGNVGAEHPAGEALDLQCVLIHRLELDNRRGDGTDALLVAQFDATGRRTSLREREIHTQPAA